mgnify:CR=1 FL=1
MNKIIFAILSCTLILILLPGCAMLEQLFGNPSAPPTEPTGDLETASCRADPYIQEPALSWEYSLEITTKDSSIYINDVLYKETPSAVPPVISYSEGFLSAAALLDAANGNQDISDILSRIQNGEPCCVLETDEDSNFGKYISVYEIDNAYYFVRFFENGVVMRIHCTFIDEEVCNNEK